MISGPQHLRIEPYNARYVRKERSPLIGPFRCRNKNARLHIWVRKLSRDEQAKRPILTKDDLTNRRFAFAVINAAMKSLWSGQPVREFTASGCKWRIEKVTALAYRLP